MNRMPQALVVYAVLLVSALGFAYRSWTHEDDVDVSGAVVILDIKRTELTSVRYSSNKIDVSLEMRKDDVGDYVWVHADPKAVEAAPEPEAGLEPPDPHAPPPEDVEAAQFKAGAAGDALVESLAPFLANRVLEGVDETKLDELGLADAEATLTIERSGRDAKTYDVGGSVYGGPTVYVRDRDTGTIYVVDAKVIRPLQSAKRTLLDPVLFDTPQKDIAAVTVRAAEAEARFFQRNPDDAQATFWSNTEDGEANELAGGWLDKALRLKVSAYLAAEDEPAGMEPAFSFVVRPGHGPAVEVEVFRAWDGEGEEKWFGRSTHSRSLVQLKAAGTADAAADVAAVLDSAQ